MNTAHASKVGVDRIQLLQLAGSLDAVVAVVGEYSQTWPGDNRFDQFLVHVLADPQAASGQLSGDRYQFPIEEPSRQSYRIVNCFGKEHMKRTDDWDCSFKCRHAPLPSLFPHLNWTLEKGHSSYDRRRAQFGHGSELEFFSVAPDAAPMPGYEHVLQRLKIVVKEAVSHGLCNLRLVISATNPLTLPPHRFSDQLVMEQQMLINRCMQVCYELAGHVDLEMRNIDSLRMFVGPTSTMRNCSFRDHIVPMW